MISKDDLNEKLLIDYGAYTVYSDGTTFGATQLGEFYDHLYTTKGIQVKFVEGDGPISEDYRVRNDLRGSDNNSLFVREVRAMLVEYLAANRYNAPRAPNPRIGDWDNPGSAVQSPAEKLQYGNPADVPNEVVQAIGLGESVGEAGQRYDPKELPVADNSEARCTPQEVALPPALNAGHTLERKVQGINPDDQTLADLGYLKVKLVVSGTTYDDSRGEEGLVEKLLELGYNVNSTGIYYHQEGPLTRTRADELMADTRHAQGENTSVIDISDVVEEIAPPTGQAIPKSEAPKASRVATIEDVYALLFPEKRDRSTKSDFIKMDTFLDAYALKKESNEFSMSINRIFSERGSRTFFTRRRYYITPDELEEAVKKYQDPYFKAPNFWGKLGRTLDGELSGSPRYYLSNIDYDYEKSGKWVLKGLRNFGISLVAIAALAALITQFVYLTSPPKNNANLTSVSAPAPASTPNVRDVVEDIFVSSYESPGVDLQSPDVQPEQLQVDEFTAPEPISEPIIANPAPSVAPEPVATPAPTEVVPTPAASAIEEDEALTKALQQRLGTDGQILIKK